MPTQNTNLISPVLKSNCSVNFPSTHDDWIIPEQLLGTFPGGGSLWSWQVAWGQYQVPSAALQVWLVGMGWQGLPACSVLGREGEADIGTL